MTGRGADLVKCLVWDLDNTLLDGTLLEDGPVGLAAGVRGVLAELDRRGILQSVSSKNDHDLAWPHLHRLGVAEYFVEPQISWRPKSAAIRQIADRLGFAPHTLAFIDDEPAERAEVAFHLPQVRCYPAAQAGALVRLAEFSPPTLTAEAGARRHLYQAATRRSQARDQFTGPDEQFLRGLRMLVRIEAATDADLARLAELTARTSQLNATGVPYSDQRLRALRADPGHALLVVSLSDRFGTHGAVGAVLLARHRGVWHLKMLVTSCRVVSFGTGAALLRWLVDQAARAGVHLVASFRRTDRNRIMEVTYRFAGFAEQPCQCLASVAAAERPTGAGLLHLVPARQEPCTTMRLVADPALLTS